ncbi:Uma2 family endonuclease [Streptomyces hainanensis]|uniref:Uma2 family endonuclease n=1 Tax=Streptomyces hainanensis TaxID=402648 RepID=A0A4R4T036_9ACTN|nr:Uma2 family endonuclease [Streptomyces hainanensis]TDC68976.1 Uma2 family endonuclease [Streptomyces hainanensis]
MTLMMERPQTIETSDRAQFERLLHTLEKLDVPDGYRAEIIRGSIILSPWSKGTYRPILRSMMRQLSGHEPQGHVIDTAPFLFAFPGQNKAIGPDLHVSDAEATDIDSVHLPGAALSLVAELTSVATAQYDRAEKVEYYGKGGVPVYVLVDMERSTVTMYSKPGEQGYQRHTEIKFGDKVDVPAPFDCELDTADWKS